MRFPIEALRPKPIKELYSEGSGPMLQAALTDILLIYKLRRELDAEMLQSLEKAVCALWGDNALLQPMIAAISARTSVEGTLAEMICSFLNTLQNDVELTPRSRFIRDLYLVQQVANSLARSCIEPLAVNAIVAGWYQVLKNQSFLMRSPRTNSAKIEAALQGVSEKGLRGAGALFRSVAPAIGETLSHEWDVYFRA